MSDVSDGVRLNRYIALCGECSRRKADLLIEAGRVSVNGSTVTDFSFRVREGDRVSVDGDRISPAKKTYVILNKPRGILSAVSDKRDKTVIDILPDRLKGLGLFPAGRLDKDSEGLIILTNDGIFSQNLIHPSKGHLKTYEVRLRSELGEDGLRNWRGGLAVDGKLIKPVSVSRISRKPEGLWYEVVLAEGVKREIRLMAEALGNRVTKLFRRKIGKLELRKLKSGEYLEVDGVELKRYIKRGKIV